MGYFFLAMLAGSLLNIVVEVIAKRNGSPEDKSYHVWTYVKEFPYVTLAMFLGSVVGFLILDEMGQLNYASAFGMGMAADRAADLARQRFEKIK